MNKITFPLKQVMQGAVVTDLQDALQLCLDRRVLLAADDAARREMSEALARERIGQTYRDATAKLVSLFQDARGHGCSRRQWGGSARGRLAGARRANARLS